MQALSLFRRQCILGRPRGMMLPTLKMLTNQLLDVQWSTPPSDLNKITEMGLYVKMVST